MKYAAFILALLLTTSCAMLTRQNDIVERDEFLNKLSMFNNEILGELKYDNQDLDLKTLGINNYPELFGKVDLTEDYKRVVNFVQKHTLERRFVVQQNTFIICLRSENYHFVICDDASTPDPTPDKVHIDEPVPALDRFYSDFLGEVGQIKKRY